VPVNVAALVLKAKPGGELACKVSNYFFVDDNGGRERGVVSYYATRSLLQATTLESWLTAILALSGADFEAGRLTPMYQFTLQVLGDAKTTVPGKPVALQEIEH
jgi:hypothetical protein